MRNYIPQGNGDTYKPEIYLRVAACQRYFKTQSIECFAG